MARDGLVLPRFLGPASSLDCGMWSSMTASGNAAVSCPLCAAITEIEPPWTVDPDGRVIPIWSCARCPCLEWVTLEIGDGT